MNPPSVRICEVAFHVLNMRTRLPFKNGIASLSALPHLLVRVELEVAGRRGHGIAAEGLPPKWFTKDPKTLFEADLADMLEVIHHAADLVVEVGEQSTPFHLWREVDAGQGGWARERGFPPLLAGLGTSLTERAMLDGVGRVTGHPFHELLRRGGLGFEPAAVHSELDGHSLQALVPAEPVRRVAVRHTVGLADPLDDGDITAEERLADGLPQSLAASIRRYGLRYFKVKLCGDVHRDLDRLRRIAAVLEATQVAAPRWTLDGNEQFGSVEAFRLFWDQWVQEPRLERFRQGLVVVEQPLSRAVALAEETGRDLRDWRVRPPMIIDESDGESGALPLALEQGYVGTSHKNCKGVFRGVANACLLSTRTRRGAGPTGVLTSEDLASVGPVAMPSDLAVAATLGLTHSERNGHHYFRGLSMFPGEVQEAVLRVHGDLYERAEAGFATLRIEGGEVATGSLLAAPFGCGWDLDVRQFRPLSEWSPASLGS